MRFRTVFVGAAVVALAGAAAAPALASATSAADTPSSVGNVSDVKAATFMIRGHELKVATVSFDYTCGGVGDMKHLFVAVKQGPEVNNTDHTSSSFADTFYSTNWHPDAGVNAITCDGVNRHARVILLPDPGFAISSGPHPALTNGTALVQLCVYDNSGGPGNDVPSASDYNMHDVTVVHSAA